MRTSISLTLITLACAQNDECKLSVELILVQDASGSMYKFADHMAENTDQLVDELGSSFGEFKYGVSSFIDKPMPTRGMGYYGNYASLGLPPDYCYAEYSALSDNIDVIHGGQVTMRYHQGSGGDYPENPYEALIMAAYSKSAGWSAPHITHSESGRRIVRIALVVTDDIPHEAGDAYGATLAWGAERTYADYYNSRGGFGSRSYGRTPNYMFYENEDDENDYIELCDLFRIGDLGGSLNSVEQARFDALLTKFGPYPWPTIEAHPGDDSKNCNITEYPSLTQVADALNKYKITPIFLIAEPNNWDKGVKKKCAALGMNADLDCLKHLYSLDLSKMGYTGRVVSVTVETEIKDILIAAHLVTDEVCRDLPTEEPTTTTTTTTTTASTTPTTSTTSTTSTTPTTPTTSTTPTTPTTSITTEVSTTTELTTAAESSSHTTMESTTQTVNSPSSAASSSEGDTTVNFSMDSEASFSESDTTVDLSMDSSQSTTVGLSDTTVGLSDTTVGLSDTTVGLCKLSVELLLVQDASGSLYKFADHMAETTDQLVDELGSSFGEFKYGVSSFIDKPMPTRGLGYYGNYASWGLPPDYCYAEHSALSDNIDVIHGGQDTMRYHIGSGGDFPENPYEALIFAAYSTSAGWSAPHITHSESGRRIVRIALIVTDDIPHETGDAYNGATLAWGAERTYADYYNSQGGFGSKSYGRVANFMFYANEDDENDYIELCDLFRIGDFGGSLNSVEQARFDALLTKFGPYPWPTIEAHPGDVSKNCNITEYPSLTQVADALNKHKITPIFLIAEPEVWDKGVTRKCAALGMNADLDCLKHLYSLDLAKMGYTDPVVSVTVDTEINDILFAAHLVTDKLCPLVSTTEEPTITEEPTTSKASTTTTAELTFGLSDTTIGLSDTTSDLSDTTIGLSDTTVDLSDTTVILSETTVGLSDTTTVVLETLATDQSETTVSLSVPTDYTAAPVETTQPSATDVELSTLEETTPTTTTTKKTTTRTTKSTSTATTTQPETETSVVLETV